MAASVAWTATVDFYNAANQLLGTVLLSAAANTSQFAGWEDLTALVSRVRITDTATNAATVLIDDFATEFFEPAPDPGPSVPAPLAAGPAALLLVGLAHPRRRRRLIRTIFR